MAVIPDTAHALQAHLEGYNGGDELDTKLVETFKAQLTDENQTTALPIFLPLITKVLPLTPKPEPLTQLLLALLEKIPFSALIQLTSKDELLPTLTHPAPSIQIMGLKLLQKAAYSSAEASLLAGTPEFVGSLVSLSLTATSTEVSELASSVLLSLLAVDLTGPEGQGEGLMWRRLFGDKDIYSAIFELCSWRSKTPSMSRAEKTLSQARLLAIIPQMGSLNWDMLSASHFPQVEAKYEGSGSSGLLSFAEGMVEMELDVLMYMTVIDFYAQFVLCRPTLTAEEGIYTTSKGLEYLISSGRHESTMALYLTPDSEQDAFTASFLTSRSARYIAVYSTHFPSHMLAIPGLMQKIVKSIQSNLPPPNNRDPHSPSLHLLSSLPATEVSDVITSVPLSPPHPEYLSTLSILLPANEALYRKYLNAYPLFYRKLTEYSSIVALKENALAALQLFFTLSSSPFGVRDILSTTSVMEFLVTVPQRFTANVGRGGEENAAFLVANKRWDVVNNVAKALASGGDDFEEHRRVWGGIVTERVAGGPWGGINGGGGVGGSIAWEGM